MNKGAKGLTDLDEHKSTISAPTRIDGLTLSDQTVGGGETKLQGRWARFEGPSER